jgi:tRNA nucleotidyltransferase/poly(A) polymerase
MTTIQQVSRIVSPVYLVGGSVRDTLLGHEPKDFDFATPLPPDEIEKAVENAGLRTYTAGKRFGTIGFKIGDRMVEITTFRLETYTPGSRKPAVEFVDDITHDLSRRDFTINAMAMRQDGSIVDPFNGQDDLQKRLIRTVNKPYERYNEDPLRMLRAARFAAQLDFAIEEQTEHQAFKKAHKILEVSKERWVKELDKLLMSDHPKRGLGFLARTHLINFMIPELGIQVGYDQDSPYHQLELWDHTLKTVSLTPKDLSLRWAALLHDVGKPFARLKNKRGYSNYTFHELIGGGLTEKIGQYLKWPSERTRVVSQLVYDHLKPDSPLHNADTAATQA